MARIVTQEQIALKAGVSRTAVSKVLGGRATEARISPAIAARIARVADELNYRPNAAARAMRDRRSRNIAILVSSMGNRPFDDPGSMHLLMGVNNELARRGYTATLVRIDEFDEQLAGQSRVFAEHTVDGIIVMNTVDPQAIERVVALVPECVRVDCGPFEPRGCILRDERAVGRMAADALAGAGFRTLVWIGPDDSDNRHYSVRDRFDGVAAYAEAHGLTLERLTNNSMGGFPALDEQLLELSRRDVGLVVYDTRIIEAMAYRMPGVGAGAPRPYGFVCCDDKLGFEMVWPELSRPSVDRFEIGRLAADMMLRRLAGDDDAPSRKIAPPWIAGSTFRPTRP